MPDLCECCQKNEVQVLELSTAQGYYFKLCNICFERLSNKALRPSEFFNLATIHSIDNSYLHDDFYDWETGKALQPSEKVINASKFPFPSANQLKDSYKKLIDLACIQFELDNNIVTSLQVFEAEKILEYLNSKVVYNRSINSYAYTVAARVLGSSAEKWVRQQWSSHRPDELFAFAEALKACLPFDDAFEIATAELQKGSDIEMAENVTILCYFESSATLDWIESMRQRITNVGTGWGVVAAASKLDWATAEKWLLAGRPLSLIALDALIYCTTKGDRQNQADWLRKYPPILKNQPSLEEITQSLTEYLKKDSVPRTKNAVRRITENLQ